MTKTGPRDDTKLAAIKLEWWPRSDWNKWPPSLESAVDGIFWGLGLHPQQGAAQGRLQDLKAARDAALVDAGQTPKQIALLENAAQEASIILERLAAVRPLLQRKLSEAQQAGRWREVERLDAAAEAAIAAFRDAIPGYEKAARQIAAFCRLGRAAEFAISQARTAGVAQGGTTAFNIPSCGGGRLGFADTIVLPANGKWHDLGEFTAGGPNDQLLKSEVADATKAKRPDTTGDRPSHRHSRPLAVLGRPHIRAGRRGGDPRR
jgi:hypothetical protein